MKSVELIHIICEEEINHVKIGVHWFSKLCESQNKHPIKTFHELAIKYSGVIPPPFNSKDRKLAGMGEEWYMPIAVKKKDDHYKIDLSCSQHSFSS